MTEKFKFKPFDWYAEPTAENLEKLNSIRSLYYAYHDSGLPVEEIAPEFYESVGKILVGSWLEDVDLKYVEFESPGRAKALILSIPLLESQIRDLLDSNIREESKEGLHSLLGTLQHYCEEDVKGIKLISGSEKRNGL
jgi:hypothetical protein